MKLTLQQLIAMTLALTFGLFHSAYAQETASDGAKATDTAGATEGDEDAATTAARLRYGPNKSSVKFGEQELYLLAGKPEAEKDPGYAAVDSLKTGDTVQMTLGQAVKLSTPFDLTFGKLTIKKENVAPNYPGVYSVWMKKTALGWNFVFNEKPDIWGTMHKADSDVGEIAAAYTVLDEAVESVALEMTAADGNGTMTISWGKHQWSAPFTFQP